jgi:hypothetical protein
MTADADDLDSRAAALVRAIESLLRELLLDSTTKPNKEEVVQQYARAIVVRCLDRVADG